MLKPMPLDLIHIITPTLKHPTDHNSIDLDNFFGFIKVEVECPDTVTRPLLPPPYGRGNIPVRKGGGEQSFQ